MRKRNVAFHNCKLRSRSQSCLPELLPGATYFQRFKRSLRKSMLISFHHPQTKKIFHSSAQILMERKRHIILYPFYIIHPFSLFGMYWNIFIFFMHVCHILTSVMVAIIYESDLDTPLLNMFDLFTSIALYINVVLNFIMGYTKHDDQLIILDQRLIRNNYLIGMFIFDIVYYLPFLLINAMIKGDDLNYSLKIVIVVILYILTLFSTVFNYHYWFAFVNKVITSKRWRFFSRIVAYKLLYLHCVTCLRETLCLLILDRSCDRAFEKEYSLHGAYINSFLIVLTSSLNCGSSASILDNSAIDFLLISFVILIGWFYYIYLVLSIANIFISNETSKYRFQSLLNEIETYCRMRRVPEYVMAKIHRHYVTKFKMNYFNETMINKTISDAILLDIQMHNCRRLVVNVPLFHDLPKILIENIVRHLRHEIYVPGDVILYANSVGESMYFIASGTAIVISSFGHEIGHLVDGAHFGEISLLLQQQRRIASVIAVEICEVYKLHREDFYKVIKPHRDILEIMENTAFARIQQTHDISHHSSG